MSRYEDYDCYYNNHYAYDDIVNNCDDLYSEDISEYEYQDDELWDNYYHNIADELTEE